MQQKVGGNAEVVRIQVLESLGSGGFGSVYRCIKRQKGIQSKQDICLKLVCLIYYIFFLKVYN